MTSTGGSTDVGHSSSLEPIEILARQRELCGYGMLDELETVLDAAATKPIACRIPLHGPETAILANFPPAVLFLTTTVGLTTVDDPNPILVPPDVAHHMRSRDMGFDGAVRACYPDGDAAPGWRAFHRQLAQGLDLVKWARWANTSLVSVWLRHLVWDEGDVPKGEYGCRLKVKWTDVLGVEQGESFGVGKLKYSGALPSVQEHYGLRCDRSCVLHLEVVRKGLLSNSTVAQAVIGFANQGTKDTFVDLLKPGTEQKRGSIRVVISSIRHRYTELLEELATLESKRAQQQEEQEAVNVSSADAAFDRRSVGSVATVSTTVHAHRRQLSSTDRVRARRRGSVGSTTSGAGPSESPSDGRLDPRRRSAATHSLSSLAVGERPLSPTSPSTLVVPPSTPPTTTAQEEADALPSPTSPPPQQPSEIDPPPRGTPATEMTAGEAEHVRHRLSKGAHTKRVSIDGVSAAESCRQRHRRRRSAMGDTDDGDGEDDDRPPQRLGGDILQEG